MYHVVLRDASFWDFLFTVDKDPAAIARKQGCGCGGRLHCANYPRKPRGGCENLPESYGQGRPHHYAGFRPASSRVDPESVSRHSALGTPNQTQLRFNEGIPTNKRPHHPPWKTVSGARKR